MRFVIFQYISSCSGFHYSTNSISAGVSWPLKRPSKPPLELDGRNSLSAVSLAAVVLLLRLANGLSKVRGSNHRCWSEVSVLLVLMANTRKDGNGFQRCCLSQTKSCCVLWKLDSGSEGPEYSLVMNGYFQWTTWKGQKVGKSVWKLNYIG